MTVTVLTGVASLGRRHSIGTGFTYRQDNQAYRDMPLTYITSKEPVRHVRGPGVTEGGMIVTVSTVGQLLGTVATDAASALTPKVMRGAG